MGRHEAVAMGRHTDLVLDASLPKHKKSGNIKHDFHRVPVNNPQVPLLSTNFMNVDEKPNCWPGTQI